MHSYCGGVKEKLVQRKLSNWDDLIKLGMCPGASWLDFKAVIKTKDAKIFKNRESALVWRKNFGYQLIDYFGIKNYLFVILRVYSILIICIEINLKETNASNFRSFLLELTTVPDSNLNNMADLYNAMSESYDEIDNEAFYINQFQMYFNHLEAWKESLQGSVIDIGCGTGIQTLWLAKNAEKVIGIDIARKLLLKAQNKLLQSKNTSLILADATELPFQDNVFDASISYGETLSHLANYKSGFSEMCRIVKPGGFIGFSVLNKCNFSLIYSPRELAKAFKNSYGHLRTWKCFDDVGILRQTDLKTFTKEEIENLGKKFGFYVLQTIGIHIWSLLIPLSFQYDSKGFWKKSFLALESVDRKTANWPLLNNFGYTTIYAARKL